MDVLCPTGSNHKQNATKNCCRHAGKDRRRAFRLQTTIVSFCLRVDRCGDVKNLSLFKKNISRSTVYHCECVWSTALFLFHFILFRSIARTRFHAIGVRSRHPKES